MKKKQIEKEKLGVVFSVRLSDEETKDWFLKYLKKNSLGNTISEQFRAFVLALKNKEVPKITIIEPAIKCQKLQRALRYFCLRCQSQHNEVFKLCPNRDWRQTHLGVR